MPPGDALPGPTRRGELAVVAESKPAGEDTGLEIVLGTRIGIDTADQGSVILGVGAVKSSGESAIALGLGAGQTSLPANSISIGKDSSGSEGGISMGVSSSAAANSVALGSSSSAQPPKESPMGDTARSLGFRSRWQWAREAQPKVPASPWASAANALAFGRCPGT